MDYEIHKLLELIMSHKDGVDKVNKSIRVIIDKKIIPIESYINIIRDIIFNEEFRNGTYRTNIKNNIDLYNILILLFLIWKYTFVFVV